MNPETIELFLYSSYTSSQPPLPFKTFWRCWQSASRGNDFAP